MKNIHSSDRARICSLQVIGDKRRIGKDAIAQCKQASCQVINAAQLAELSLILPVVNVNSLSADMQLLG